MGAFAADWPGHGGSKHPHPSPPRAPPPHRTHQRLHLVRQLHALPRGGAAHLAAARRPPLFPKPLFLRVWPCSWSCSCRRAAQASITSLKPARVSTVMSGLAAAATAARAASTFGGAVLKGLRCSLSLGRSAVAAVAASLPSPPPSPPSMTFRNQESSRSRSTVRMPHAAAAATSFAASSPTCHQQPPPVINPLPLPSPPLLCLRFDEARRPRWPPGRWPATACAPERRRRPPRTHRARSRAPAAGCAPGPRGRW